MLRSHVGYGSRERPAVTAKILGCVNPLPEWHVGRWLHDSRTESFRVLEMPIDVLNTNNYILVDLIRVRRPKRRAVRA